MKDLVPWTLREDFESKIKENEKYLFVLIAINLTRLKIETDSRKGNKHGICDFFSHLVAGKSEFGCF